MENERNENTINLKDNIFNLEYSEQNISNNKKYKKWEESMLKIYGNDAKLFKCIQDKILFFTTYDDCINYPAYKCKCPKCGNIICHFCSSIDTLNVICCYKRLIYNILFHNGLSFIKKVDRNEDIQLISNDYTILLILIPGLNLCATNYIYVDITLFSLITNTIAYDDKGNRETYLYKFQKSCFSSIIIYLFAFSFFLNSISFFILNFYFIIFLILISIPFKFYPLKYYFGLISTL